MMQGQSVSTVSGRPKALAGLRLGSFRNYLAFVPLATQSGLRVKERARGNPRALKGLLVNGLVIKHAVFPASIENADPFKRQRADRRVMVHSS